MSKRAQRVKRDGKATPQWESDFALLNQYLTRYGREPRFASAIIDLYRDIESDIDAFPLFELWEHVRGQWDQNGVSIHSDYVRRVERFVERWKLDWLPNSKGYEAVHDWLCARHWSLKERDKRVTEPKSFGALTWAGDGTPDNPTVNVRITESWDYRHETWGAFCQRIDDAWKQQRAAALATIHKAADDENLDLPSPQESETERHLQWVFWRVVYGWSFVKIASKDGSARNEDVIRQEIAKRMDKLHFTRRTP